MQLRSLHWFINIFFLFFTNNSVTAERRVYPLHSLLPHVLVSASHESFCLGIWYFLETEQRCKDKKKMRGTSVENRPIADQTFIGTESNLQRQHSCDGQTKFGLVLEFSSCCRSHFYLLFTHIPQRLLFSVRSACAASLWHISASFSSFYLPLIYPCLPSSLLDVFPLSYFMCSSCLSPLTTNQMMCIDVVSTSYLVAFQSISLYGNPKLKYQEYETPFQKSKAPQLV